MKYVLFLFFTFLVACSTAPRSPQENMCRDTCSEQNLRFWAVGDNGACDCIEKMTREPRGRD